MRRIVHELVEQVLDTEASALADEPDGVHDHRTQVRRLRGTLAATRRLFEPAATAALSVSLREWGRQLGEVRDAEVAVDIAEKALTEAEIDDPAAWQRLVFEPRVEYRRLHARLTELSATPRAQRRTRQLVELRSSPLAVEPDADAAEVFMQLLRREARRVRRAAAHVDGSMAGYHDVRKAGRRLRYVADAVGHAAPELFGEAGTRLAHAGRRVHDILGDHRDALLFAELLERERSLALRAGEATAPYDRMIADATDRAQQRLSQLEHATTRVRKAAAALG